jgi:hypothetical protein
MWNQNRSSKNSIMSFVRISQTNRLHDRSKMHNIGTGNSSFPPFSSDVRNVVVAEERKGDLQSCVDQPGRTSIQLELDVGQQYSRKRQCTASYQLKSSKTAVFGSSLGIVTPTECQTCGMLINPHHTKSKSGTRQTWRGALSARDNDDALHRAQHAQYIDGPLLRDGSWAKMKGVLVSNVAPSDDFGLASADCGRIISFCVSATERRIWAADANATISLDHPTTTIPTPVTPINTLTPVLDIWSAQHAFGVSFRSCCHVAGRAAGLPPGDAVQRMADATARVVGDAESLELLMKGEVGKNEASKESHRDVPSIASSHFASLSPTTSNTSVKTVHSVGESYVLMYWEKGRVRAMAMCRVSTSRHFYILQALFFNRFTSFLFVLSVASVCSIRSRRHHPRLHGRGSHLDC